jgi:hypothetical protein
MLHKHSVLICKYYCPHCLLQVRMLCCKVKHTTDTRLCGPQYIFPCNMLLDFNIIGNHFTRKLCLNLSRILCTSSLYNDIFWNISSSCKIGALFNLLKHGDYVPAASTLKRLYILAQSVFRPMSFIWYSFNWLVFLMDINGFILRMKLDFKY